MHTFLTPEHVLLFGRMVLGVVMVMYGWPKIRDLRANAKQFDSMGFRPGWLFGTPVALVEFVGGIFLIAGAATGLVAAAFGFQMLLGTLWKIKIGKAFSDWSYDVLALVVALMILVAGGGTYSFHCSVTGLLSWDIVIGAVVIAMIAAILSKPSMKK